METKKQKEDSFTENKMKEFEEEFKEVVGNFYDINDIRNYFKSSLTQQKEAIEKEWRNKIEERIVLLQKQEEELEEQFLHKDSISQLKELLK